VSEESLIEGRVAQKKRKKIYRLISVKEGRTGAEGGGGGREGDCQGRRNRGKKEGGRISLVPSFVLNREEMAGRGRLSIVTEREEPSASHWTRGKKREGSSLSTPEKNTSCLLPSGKGKKKGRGFGTFSPAGKGKGGGKARLPMNEGNPCT